MTALCNDNNNDKYVPFNIPFTQYRYLYYTHIIFLLDVLLSYLARHRSQPGVNGLYLETCQNGKYYTISFSA